MASAENKWKPERRQGHRSEGDDTAKKRIERLLELARRKRGAGEADLSRRYVALARRIAMRHRIRLGSSLFCKKCDTLAVLGKTTVIRVEKKKAYAVCTNCGSKKLQPKTIRD